MATGQPLGDTVSHFDNSSLDCDSADSEEVRRKPSIKSECIEESKGPPSPHPTTKLGDMGSQFGNLSLDCDSADSEEVRSKPSIKSECTAKDEESKGPPSPHPITSEITKLGDMGSQFDNSSPADSEEVRSKPSIKSECTAKDEESKPLRPPSSVLLKPINVGQGDSLLLEITTQLGAVTKHYVLVDGGKGTLEHHKNLIATLNVHGCLDARTRQLTLQAIVLTHPDSDHVQGLNRLFEEYEVDCDLIATTAARVMVDGKDLEGEIYKPSEDSCITYQLPHVTVEKQKIEIKRYHINQAKVEISKNDKIPQNKFNDTSIITRVQTSADTEIITLTGDSQGKIIYEVNPELREEKIGIFQVPHHGSATNSKVTGAAKDKLPEGHPLTPLRKFRGRPAYAQALFYFNMKADIYLFSHGNNEGYQHPNWKTVTGILIAAAINKHKCKIVVTATEFHKDKIRYPKCDIPQDWEKYVEILHFKQGIPFVTIDPLHPEIIDNNLEVWTEDGSRGGPQTRSQTHNDRQ